MEIVNLKRDVNNFISQQRKNKLPFIDDIDETLIVSIVLGKAIPFCIRHADILNQPTHSLFKEVGETLQREVIKELNIKIKNEIETLSLENESDLKDENIISTINKNIELHKENIIKVESIDEENILKIGLDFIALFGNNSNFFSLEEKLVNKNESKRFLLPKNKLELLINEITLMDTIEIPMIITPME